VIEILYIYSIIQSIYGNRYRSVAIITFQKLKVLTKIVNTRAIFTQLHSLIERITLW